MPENNPMLEQLKAALENPHFKVLAEKVAQEMLGASFEDSMNAHPDVATVEGRWLGTLKRLVCNTVLTTYNEVMAGRFSAAHWARAEAEMEHYHSQVQGFFYPDDPAVIQTADANGEEVKYMNEERPGYGAHVVRDLTLPPGSQTIWQMSMDRSKVEESEVSAKAEYDRCHSAMMQAIRERQISMTWTHYLWGVTSGHFEKGEAEV